MEGNAMDTNIPMSWLIERARQSGDVRMVEMVRRLVSDYVMSQMNADLLSQLDEAEAECKQASAPQLININRPSGDVILSGGKKDETTIN